MSAIEQDGLQGMDGQASFEFAQKVAVPSYVIALVVGDLQTKKVGDRVNASPNQAKWQRWLINCKT